MTYFKKQKKHTHSIYLNTDDAHYVDAERKTFSFKIPPINIEDESKLYVKNTIIDYKTTGLSVKDVNLPYISTTGISTGYNAPPNIIFTPQDGKGTGATAVGILQPVPLSTSATGSSTAIGVVSGGSGYAGLGSEYISTFTDPASGGTGASILPTINTSTSTLPTAITSTPVASGSGTIGTSDRHITFAYYGTGATGDYTFTTTEELLCDVLVVAGGGGGGEKYGGGGGGGALYYAQNMLLPAGSYIARVGKGGVPVAIADNAGSGAGAGNPSSLSFNGTNIIFMRGGAGGASGGANTYGAFGGSGSGGAGPAGLGQNAGSGTNIPAGTYGNKGGNALQIAGIANTICGGGGGGAGGAGGNATIDPNGTQTRAGAGGTGLVVNLTGTSTTFCGGGGGGATTNGSFAGTAGAGGGGAGGSGTAGTSGTNNLGGGGGGGGWTGTTAYAGGSGGNGYVVIKYTRNINRNGNITSAVLTAGSGYVDLPVINTPTPVSEPATFGTIAYSTTNGNITAVPAVLNPTTNGFYNASTFRASFVNNPVQLQGFCQTDGAGTITWITISNSGNNGYYRITAPPVILAINGVLLGSGFGVGLQYDFTYSAGRATACSVINGGSGYGNNLVDAPVLFSAPAIPTTATILSKEIVNGRLQSLVMGAGGSRYYKPSIEITDGLVAPVPALYNPIYLRPSQLRGVRMLTNGRGYTKPPLVGISTATKTPSLNGDMPLTAEMTQSNLVEPNFVYTIKAEGFTFNRTLYTNSDYKGRPTIAITSPDEIINDEEYGELVLPAQVINDITLTITERGGEGLDPNRNLTMLLQITELDENDSSYYESKRQIYH